MKFFMPTRVLMGKDIILNNKEIFKDFGKKALIVTGKSSAKNNGSLDDVLRALEDNSIEWIIFDKVEENPSVETIIDAAKIGKAEKVDFIIGIGGGSPVDASKAIGVMIKNRELTRDTLFTTEKLDSLDIIAVSTTSGTGSEVTQYSILTDNKMKTKRNLGQEIFPKIAFLDPKYTVGMNERITKNTAIDAFTHIVEGYLNRNANAITDGLSETALKLFGKALPALKSGKFSYEDRENLMIISNIAGVIIANTGTSIPHGMGYALTYNKNIPHGLANGVLYVEYMKVFKNRHKVDNIYKFLGLENHKELEKLLKNICKVDVEITEEELREYSREFANNKDKLKNHTEDISEEEIYDIYKNSFVYL